MVQWLLAIPMVYESWINICNHGQLSPKPRNHRSDTKTHGWWTHRMFVCVFIPKSASFNSSVNNSELLVIDFSSYRCTSK